MAKFWTKIRETKRWIVILNFIVGMEWLQIYITTHKNDLNSWSEIIKICKKNPLFMTPPPCESNPRLEHHPNEIISTHVEAVQKQLEIFSVTCLQNLLVFSNQVQIKSNIRLV